MTFALIPKSVRFFVISLAIPLALTGGIVTPACAAQTASKPLSSLLGVSSVSKPAWADLSPAQKQMLAPLSPEWDKMSELGKKKWLEIANRYPAMKPDEQARLQERMRDWVKLTPEQRMAARENYAKSTQLKPEHKSAQWQQYQQLSDEEKMRLATENQKKKSVTNLPSEALKNPKILAPIKVGPTPTSKAKPTPVVVTPPAQVTPVAASAVAVMPAVNPASTPASSTVDSAPASNPALQGTSK